MSKIYDGWYFTIKDEAGAIYPRSGYVQRKTKSGALNHVYRMFSGKLAKNRIALKRAKFSI